MSGFLRKAARYFEKRAAASFPKKKATNERVGKRDCRFLSSFLHLLLVLCIFHFDAMASSPSGSEITLSSSASPRRKSAKLPITSIPDMRFEQSYLASVRGFVKEYSPSSAEDKKEEERRGDGKSEGGKAPDIMTSHSPKGEPELWLGRLQVQWCVFLYCFFTARQSRRLTTRTILKGGRFFTSLFGIRFFRRYYKVPSLALVVWL